VTPTQKQFGGVEKLRIVIDLEVYGCHDDDVIDPVRYLAFVQKAVNQIKGTCIKSTVTVEKP
jgi:hypothetical protein